MKEYSLLKMAHGLAHAAQLEEQAERNQDAIAYLSASYALYCLADHQSGMSTTYRNLVLFELTGKNLKRVLLKGQADVIKGLYFLTRIADYDQNHS